jgi:hypothetical protein
MTDFPAELQFVDPDETDDTWRVCLWAAGGQGKTVAAASAPGPILALSADRPSAYKFARKHHGHTAETLREVRYRDHNTLHQVTRYLTEHPEIKTLIIDPVSNIYDQLVDTAPLKGDGEVDYQKVNKVLLGFVKHLRTFDVNVVLVAYERLNDGKKGDGKMYPALGGPTLINKLIGEMDIVARIERHVRPGEDGEEDNVQWVAQIQPRDNLVCKDGTDALGPRRIADLTRWFQLASDSLRPDTTDLPFADDFQPPAEDPADPGHQISMEPVS